MLSTHCPIQLSNAGASNVVAWRMAVGSEAAVIAMLVTGHRRPGCDRSSRKGMGSRSSGTGFGRRTRRQRRLLSSAQQRKAPSEWASESEAPLAVKHTIWFGGNVRFGVFGVHYPVPEHGGVRWKPQLLCLGLAVHEAWVYEQPSGGGVPLFCRCLQKIIPESCTKRFKQYDWLSMDIMTGLLENTDAVEPTL